MNHRGRGPSFGQTVYPSPSGNRREGQIGVTPLMRCIQCGFPNDTRKTSWSNVGEGFGDVTNIFDSFSSLVSATNSGQLQMTVLNGKYFKASNGVVKIDNEIVFYAQGLLQIQATGNYLFNFLDCVRGYLGTVAASHALGATVKILNAIDHPVQSGCSFCGSLRWRDSKVTPLKEDRFKPSSEWYRKIGRR